jgi:hypothetical protein
MNPPDRLRSLSIVGVAIAILALSFDVFSHAKSQFSSLVITMILFVTALEKIRLELRDIRAELLKRETDVKRVATPTI